MSHDPECERLAYSVVGAFYEVYNTLGCGFLEHLYVMALERELLSRGHQVGREVAVPVMYKGEQLGIQRLDMIVDEKLVVEVKSTRDLNKPAMGGQRWSARAQDRSPWVGPFRWRSWTPPLRSSV